MGTVIGESQKVDNPTLNCVLNFSEIKIRLFRDWKYIKNEITPENSEVLSVLILKIRY
tara:strand:- start:1222 stop:1395 length:174 start_codon:yes stop_codon:yes gene_type:complete